MLLQTVGMKVKGQKTEKKAYNTQIEEKATAVEPVTVRLTATTRKKVYQA